jgi:glycosyltransferase involved in cell wall biosynthesis
MSARETTEWMGAVIHPYSAGRGSTPGVHPWVSDFETKTIRGEACMRAAINLKDQGYSPNVIIAHPGWGESLFLKDVWPDTKLGIYCEFFYHAQGADVGFDSEFPIDPVVATGQMRLKNINNLLHFEVADAGISPTYWQASTFPDSFRSKITVVHDGIDTDVVAPSKSASLTLNDNVHLTPSDEVITFVNRNLEPYRGYHIFMRALPELLKRRPNARILIVGGDGVSYGARPPQGKDGSTNWKDIFANEVRQKISDSDWSRVFFLGNISYQHFIPLLQISTVHVYLTYPFVLSWSLLEAMSAGCAIVASDTAPLREAIKHDETGRLVDFFDIDSLVTEVCELLTDSSTRERLGRAARKFAQDTYDLKTICLPKQLEWVEKLVK